MSVGCSCIVNFRKVQEISENAERCTKSGTVTQHTFKSLKTSISDKVFDNLKKILEQGFK